jgi:hypothetical protein
MDIDVEGDSDDDEALSSWRFGRGGKPHRYGYEGHALLVEFAHTNPKRI